MLFKVIRFTATIILINFCVNVNGQNAEPTISDSTKTLFSSVKINTVGLYVAPELQFGQFANDFTTLKGGSLMAILNKRFAVGATILSNQRNFTPTEINANEALRLRYRSSGLRLEYTFAPHKLVHFSIPLILGFGYASVDSINATNPVNDYNGHSNGHGRNSTKYHENFVYIQPALHLDVNIFKYAKWFLGAGYRFNVYSESNIASLYDLSNNQLSGITFQTGLKLGLFGYNLKKSNQ